MARPIIEIDEDKCDGCGQCILDCAEGALAIVDGKARLISETYCDGLGACLNCPKGALTLRMKDASPFDEKAALAAKAAREKKPALKPIAPLNASQGKTGDLRSDLPSWPIQLELIPPNAKYLQGADLLLAAHCSGFALSNLQQNWMKGRIPLIACPKLEDNRKLIDRLAAILEQNDIKSLSILRMSVPCCSGLERIAAEALKKSGKATEVKTHVVQI